MSAYDHDIGEECLECGGPTFWNFHEAKDEDYWFRQCMDCGKQYLGEVENRPKKYKFRVLQGGGR